MSKNNENQSPNRSGNGMWYFQLSRNFFSDTNIKRLEKTVGYEGVLIYLKIILEALDNEGFIFFDGLEDNIYEQLAFSLDHNSDTIKETFERCIKYQLITEDPEREGKAYWIGGVADNMKHLGASGMRMRNLRARRKEGMSQSDKNPSQSADNKNKVKEESDSDSDSDSELELDSQNSYSKSYSVVSNDTTVNDCSDVSGASGGAPEGSTRPGKSVDDLFSIRNQYGVKLSYEGVAAFHEETSGGLQLWGQSIPGESFKTIQHAMNAWASKQRKDGKHPEYESAEKWLVPKAADPRDSKPVPVLAIRGQAPGWNEGGPIEDEGYEEEIQWGTLYNHSKPYSKTYLKEIVSDCESNYEITEHSSVKEFVIDQIEFEISSVFYAYVNGDSFYEASEQGYGDAFRRYADYVPGESLSCFQLSYLKKEYEIDVSEKPTKRDYEAECWKSPNRYPSFWKTPQ